MPSYTFAYIKISNIRKMRTDIKHNHGHNSAPQGIPKAQNLTKTFLPCPQKLMRAKTAPKLVKINSFSGFLGSPKSA